MVTFIEITEGANEGSRFQAEEGLTIGRSRADVIIQDPKVSGTHAQIAVDGKGQLVLIDLDSANGILIGGRRVKKVALLSGVSFEIGHTQFKVVNVDEGFIGSFARFMTWRSILRGRISPEGESSGGGRTILEGFSPAIKLTFTQGIQADQEIILGYGPRIAGSDSLDIELWDETTPAKAFEFRPGPGVVEIKVLAPGKVTLNNKPFDAEMLKDGDLISTGNTLIKITYL